jgi:ubiquinone/menaquinone biosynthesis C-methylase UbiE
MTWLRAIIISFVCTYCFSAYALDSGQRKPINRLTPIHKIPSLDSPDRDKWQQPERVLEAFGVKEGDIVADIGAGSGYFTFRLADKVGSSGKVYAVDIQQEMLDYIKKKTEKGGINNIILVKSTETGSNLPPACCNKILVADCYLELSSPVELMKNLRNALKPGGEIAVIDKNMGAEGPPLEWRVPMEEAIGQMEEAGYKLMKTYDFLEYQYFLIFQ